MAKGCEESKQMPLLEEEEAMIFAAARKLMTLWNVLANLLLLRFLIADLGLMVSIGKRIIRGSFGA